MRGSRPAGFHAGRPGHVKSTMPVLGDGHLFLAAAVSAPCQAISTELMHQHALQTVDRQGSAEL